MRSTVIRSIGSRLLTNTRGDFSAFGHNMHQILPTPSCGFFPALAAGSGTHVPNMQAGDLLVGSFRQWTGRRKPVPSPASADTAHRSQVSIYGGSTHPGGNITGLCGYNAAHVIATIRLSRSVESTGCRACVRSLT